MELLFNESHKLKEIKGINNFNTINVNSMKAMFQECNELKYLDLSNFNTSNVTDMGFMFNECHKLKEIKGINNFNTSNVNIMRGMFQNCNELEYLDLSNFNTSKVTDMGLMFKKCYNLNILKGINNYDITNVSNMNEMFDEFNRLKNLILSKFNASITNSNYYKLINQLNEEKKKVIELKNEINNIMEQIIAVNFISTDQNINYPLACKKTDIFSNLEKKLYNEYPE